MANGNIPTPVTSTTPVLLTGALLGTTTANQRALFIQVKNAWKEAGWFVVQSYNANGTIPAPGVDTWNAYTDILGSGGGGTGFSWIVLGNPWTTMQVCLYCTVSGGWLEFQIALAMAGGFTGGTTGARPTAPKEVNDNGIATYPEFLGTGPAGNPQFYAITWVATDGSYLRTAWIYGGKLKSLWMFDQLFTTPTGWTNNAVLGMFHWGNTDYTVTGNRATTDIFTKNWGSAGSFKLALTPSPDTATQLDGSIESSAAGSLYVPDQAPNANRLSNQYIWVEPLGFIQTSSGGFWGYSRDNWWTVPSVFNDGDTMGDNYQFIIFNQLVLQWGLGPVGTLLGGASTNYPTARFYGRDMAGSSCNCGPDTCNTPTTSLIALRNGAKELADKVNDASVSDITWNVWINQGVESLWSLVSTAFSDHFFKTFDFTLTGGVGGNILDVSTVPTSATNDFRRVRLLEFMPDTASRRKIKAFNFNEKDARIGSYAGIVWCNVRRYRLMGQKLYIEPYEQAAGPYRLYYVPGPQTLTLTCDALDPAVDEWNEYPMIFAAMKALGKEESDDSQLAARMIALKAEILDAAAARNVGDNDVIADTEMGTDSGGPFWG